MKNTLSREQKSLERHKEWLRALTLKSDKTITRKTTKQTALIEYLPSAKHSLFLIIFY